MNRLAVLASHPIQYYVPIYRELAARVSLHVFYAHRATPEQQAAAGFGVNFDWDIDLTSGYAHTFLQNVSKQPGTSEFSGCDTPSIGGHLRRGRYSCVLSQGWNLNSMIQGILAARVLGLKVMIRGDSQLDTPRNPLKLATKEIFYPGFLRLFDVGLYVGKRNRAYYEHFRFPKERLIHSPHCVDTSRFARDAMPAARCALREKLGVGGTEKLVLFAGKLLSRKRPLDIVDAVAIARQQGMDAQVLIAGSGPLEPALIARAQTLRVPLHLLGFQNQSQMPSVYAAADMLVLPSTSHETWGLVCNEALACGLPIIVSEEVGCAPDLADGKAGWTFGLGDIGTLSRHILRCGNAKDTISILRLSDQYSVKAAADGIQHGVNIALDRKSTMN
jgi:glycosyltransferase involved in cell wall biosynthesis